MMLETMDDAASSAASDHGPAEDRDAIVASQGSLRIIPPKARKRRRRLTAAERFSRWMDDTDACFHVANEGAAAPSGGDRMARFLLDWRTSSLPILLAHRETVGGVRSRAVGWQRHVLARPELRPSVNRSHTKSTAAAAAANRGEGTINSSAKNFQPMRYEFRRWHRRTVPFTRLGTPRTEAVLGLDRTGSYSITLGDLDVPDEEDADHEHDNDASRPPAGLPSPAALRIGRNRSDTAQTRVASPLMMTVPLHTAPHSDFHSLTARTPTVLCLSSDGEMGVALVRAPIPLFQRMEASDLHPVVALVIFPLPRHTSMTTTPASCPCVSTVRLKTPQTSVSDRETDVKKILWKVHRLPELAAHSSVDSPSGDATDAGHVVVETPGYLLVLRQENRSCYRLTWIQSAQSRRAPRIARCRFPPPPSPDRSDRGSGCGGDATIPTPIVAGNDGCWEVSCSDRLTGCPFHPPKSSSVNDAIRVVGERWLRLDAVLEDIVRRRPKFAPPSRATSDDGTPTTPRLPIHSVDMVQVSEGGETLQAVICFMHCQRKSVMYAVFVEVDLLAPVPSYREVQWLKRSLAPHRASSRRDDVEVDLAGMAETLSLNQRMSLERVGPYSVDPEPLRDWSALCRGGTVEPDEWTVRDPDPHRWRVKATGQEDSYGIPVAADTIPYDAIYPDCHVLNNLAVLRQTPVLSLTSRSSATEIVYG